MKLVFTKMEGLGNDFIMLDDRDGKIMKAVQYPVLAKKACDRHFGVGADGIILILESRDHDFRFQIFNSDGSEAQMCGNGMRCFAKYLYDNKIVSATSIRVETAAGTVIPEVILNEDGTVTSVKVDMGVPVLSSSKVPFISDMEVAVKDRLEIRGDTFEVTCISMGNPHAVIFVEDIEKIDVQRIGRQVELHQRFPEKTNVEFIEVVNDRELKMKVWERGAGITLACGTGACASLVAGHLNGLTADKALIHLDGGDLEIEWDKKSDHIFKTGPATLVFTGEIEI